MGHRRSCTTKHLFLWKLFYKCYLLLYNILQPVATQSPWRNWLARSAVNRKVGGSSPPGDALSFPKRK